MTKPAIVIRDATFEHASFIGKCVLAAMDLYDFSISAAENPDTIAVCGRKDTLYSYKNSRLAMIEDVPVGCLVSYPGEIYEEARRLTFSLLPGVDKGMLEASGAETGPGEFYLDTLAVVPAYRGYGIGRMLLQDGIRKAREKGFPCVSLIVEAEKSRLQEYYASLGFREAGRMLFFGHEYIKCSVSLSPSENQ